MNADALTALGLLIAWGADEALDDDPTDRLAPAAAPRPQFGQPGPSFPPSSLPARSSVPGIVGSQPPIAERARAAAEAADSLEALHAAIAAFEGIGLRDTATAPILFEGDPASGVLLVGPPPSGDDDRAGRPMTGAPGAFLDAMLASIGLTRAGLLFAPLIPWRPPGDRPPSPAELAICLPFLHRLVALARPRLAVLLGPLPARALLGGERRPPRGRFTDARVPGREIPLPCLPMSTPAQLRADPDGRRAAWAELRLLRRRIDEGVTRQ